MPPKPKESLHAKAVERWREASQKYGRNVCVMIQVGSFYSLFDYESPDTGEYQTTFQEALNILNIQKNPGKKGEGPKGEKGVSAGFPDTHLHKFAGMLTRENWTVVVLDQVKTASGRVDKRVVVRVLTPGTHVEASTAETCFLAGLWLEDAGWTETGLTGAPRFAFAAMDLATGHLHTFEGVASGRKEAWTSDDLLHVFQVFPPREVMLWWRGQMLDCPDEGALRRTLGIPGAVLRVQSGAAAEQGALEKAIVREDLLRECFSLKTLLPVRTVLGLEGRPRLERAICALLQKAKELYPTAMTHLQLPRPWNPRASMALGNHALTQLNMITPREEDSVLGLFLRTQTPMGRRGIRKRLLSPLSSREDLEYRYAQIAWVQGLSAARREDLITRLRGIQDLAKLHRRISTGAINSADLLALDMTYESAKQVAALCQGVGGETAPLEMEGGLLAGLEELLAEMSEAFDLEKARRAAGGSMDKDDSENDIFCLSEERGPRCAALEREIAGARAKIKEHYEALLDWLQEDRVTLRLEWKESCIHLTGGKTMLLRIEKRLREGGTPPPALQGLQKHLKKSSNSLEIPALNRLHDEILRKQEELRVLAKEEVWPVCQELAEAYGSTVWGPLEEWISDVDVAYTLARVATERGFTRPELVEDEAGSLEVVGLRHPLIEAQQTRLEYVRHAVRLGATPDEQGWLIYGMNASGKSSLMKAVGIAVLLAQCGSYVPAEKLRLAPFGSLYTRILNTDNLWAGLSSFAVEMTELREILARADARSLVLGDELCSGTESTSATALVGASLNWLSGRGARYMFATHLHGLQALPAVTGLGGLKVWHLRVRYDAAADKLIYDRTLHPGAGSSLYGLEVAKAMALPLEVLEAAHAIRRQLTGTASESEAPASDWNRAVTRRACEVCRAEIVRDLEVHHIQQRSGAGAGGQLADGSYMNTLRNLVVVCQECHDRHHAGQLQIGAVQMTSEGPERQVLDLGRFAYTPAAGSGLGAGAPGGGSGLTEAQKEVVWGYLRQYPTISPNRALYDLEKKGVKLTVQRLRTLRGQMPAGAFLS